MKKNLAKKISAGILATFLGMGIVYCDSALAADGGLEYSGAYYGDRNTSSNGKVEGQVVTIGDNDSYKGVYGGYAFGNDNSEWTILPLLTGSAEANGNKVYINDGTITGSMVMGDRYNPIYGAVAGGWANYTSNNEVIINDGTIEADVYGGYSMVSGNAGIDHPNIVENHVKIYGGNIIGGNIAGAFVTTGGEDGNKNILIGNEVKISNATITSTKNTNGNIYGAWAEDQNAVLKGNKVFINEGSNITTGSSDSEHGMGIFGAFGQAKYTSAIGNKVVISGGMINGDVHGALANTVSKGIIENNKVVISGGKIKGNVYAGYAQSNTESFVDNKVIITGEKANLEKADLFGCNVDNFLYEDSGNDLIVDGWQGKVNSANNFNNIKFQNLNWQNEGIILEIGSANGSYLANTNINLISIAGGQKINAGDYMYIIKGNGNLNINETLVDNNFSEGVITAGVATEINGEAFVDDDGNVQYKVNGTSASYQINLVAENRAVAAAFVNQGTDLINDSLDVLSRDGKYGLKTFAAVHGNRSKYDVNSDLKINGWSSIVGVGNEKNIGNGDFSWGVFYENGSGNYRTYNEFNNEFFRGDGSLVYNGGGIAARFEQDNGIYTEGSLRVGMLKSEMTNALKDGAGNSYGYKSESSYYGAHLGVGKIISLNEATDLDVYGKFFHTYTDGDSFTVANDKFEFDGITSDRLRIGARLTTNKENKFSTYYGLAYEYEFNGDADMRAQNMSAPEQSLKGSSCMAEIGMNYKPSSESPWSFDLSMRGYAGQRDGFSGNVQATYSF